MSSGVGILHQMFAEADVDERTFLDTTIEEVRLAEAAGFASVWIGEHHFVQPAPYYGRIPSPEILIAHLAAVTSRIHFGTGIKILPLATAVQAAESMLLLDLLTNGRVEFGLGAGVDSEYDVIVDRDERYARFDETLRALLELLDGGRSSRGLPLVPAATRDLRTKIWVAARTTPLIELAAHEGLNLVVGQDEPGTAQARFVDTFRAAGGRGEVRGVRLVYVCRDDGDVDPDTATALDLMSGKLRTSAHYREAVDGGFLTEIADPTPADLRRQISFVAGTPEVVAEELEHYLAASGVDRLDVMLQMPGMPTGRTRRSMQLFMDEVWPRLGKGVRLAI